MKNFADTDTGRFILRFACVILGLFMVATPAIKFVYITTNNIETIYPPVPNLMMIAAGLLALFLAAHPGAWKPLTPPLVVEALPEDTDQIAALNNLFHVDLPNFYWNRREWVQAEIEAGNYYVIRDSKGIAGALCLHKSEKDSTGTVETIAVRQDMQASGIGRTLVNHAAETCRGHSLKVLTIESFCQCAVTGFFKRCGFIQAPEIEQYQGHDYYCFSMPL